MLMRGLRIKGGKSRRGKLSLICKAGVRNSELSRQPRSGGEGKLTGTVSVKLEKPSAAEVREGLTGTRRGNRGLGALAATSRVRILALHITCLSPDVNLKQTLKIPDLT